jgi:uncharacterized membrane protein
MHGGRLWDRHPGVRSGAQLTFGEQAADKLKAAFGSWAFVIVLNSFIGAWVVLNIWAYTHHWDPYPFILLNLLLSWIAANQGGALQIASNRGDRISSEVALHTHANTEQLAAQTREILALQQQQMTLLAGIEQVTAELSLIRRAASPQAPDPASLGHRPGEQEEEEGER